MKKVILIALIAIGCVAYATDTMRSEIAISTSQTTTSVVVCNGKSSTKYHKGNNCTGLNNCKGGSSTITLQQAKDKGRTACKSCHKG